MRVIVDKTPILPSPTPIGDNKAATLSILREDARSDRDVLHLGAILVWGRDQAEADLRAQTLAEAINWLDMENTP